MERDLGDLAVWCLVSTLTAKICWVAASLNRRQCVETWRVKCENGCRRWLALLSRSRSRLNVRMDAGVIRIASTLAIKTCWVATSLGRRWCWGSTCCRCQCGGNLCGWLRESRASTDLGWWLLGSGSTLGQALGDEQMNKWEWTNNWQMNKLGRQVGSTSGQVLENEWVNKWEWTNNWQVDKLGREVGRPLVRSWRMSEWTNKNEQTICRWTNTQYIKWQLIGAINTWEFEWKFLVIGW